MWCFSLKGSFLLSPPSPHTCTAKHSYFAVLKGAMFVCYGVNTSTGSVDSICRSVCPNLAGHHTHTPEMCYLGWRPTCLYLLSLTAWWVHHNFSMPAANILKWASWLPICTYRHSIRGTNAFFFSWFNYCPPPHPPKFMISPWFIMVI